MYSSNVVHTLHCNCNNKTRLGVYQRYYSVLCNTLPYPVKQRETLCENYRITCKYTYEVGGRGAGNCHKMYYQIVYVRYDMEGNATIMERVGEGSKVLEGEEKKPTNI